MLKSITILSKERQSRFACSSKSFDFKKGINLIVGENGSGKSTLFDTIVHGERLKAEGEIDLVAVGEFDVRSLRMQEQGRNRNTNMISDPAVYRHTISSFFCSHGQANWPILEALNSFPGEMLVLYDEPEQALDFEHLMQFRLMLKKKSSDIQFVISTHHPVFLMMDDVHIINVSKDAEYVEKLKKDYRLLCSRG